MKKNRSPPHTNGCSSGIPHFDIAAPGFDNLQWSTANVCGERPGTGFRNKQQSEALGKWYNSCGNTADCAHLCDKLEPAFRKGCKLFASWGWRRGDPEGVKFRAVECPAAFVRHVGGLFDRNGVTAGGSPPTNSWPVPAPTPPTLVVVDGSGGCCRFGVDCGDCGDDLSGWCHKSSANCNKCEGIFDPSGRAPQCGGSAPSPTPAWPSPISRPTPPTGWGTSPTPTWPSPVPRPTPPTGWGTSPTPTWPSPSPRPSPSSGWGTSPTSTWPWLCAFFMSLMST
eukprot:TRINITY_DN12863_c0_g2_i4.p1 TRINITY_DN12863_c0_g2~~TRINITY_DN12863_c0_g2_i4.p1  ORF type:complete len:304 (+),score=20.59 TRINITY_DN12863_c0_g2_i4:69-914(+)